MAIALKERGGGRGGGEGRRGEGRRRGEEKRGGEEERRRGAPVSQPVGPAVDPEQVHIWGSPRWTPGRERERRCERREDDTER